MELIYHQELLSRALAARVSARALAAITAANFGQDSPRNLLRLAWHFDNSLFAEGVAYIEACRAAAASAREPAAAWAAFGRLTHAAQDFYAHSNYVALWLAEWRAQHAPAGYPPPAAINGLDPALLRHPDLISGRVYLPEVLGFFPALRGVVRRLVPRDAHAWMNLDSPAAGRLFPYALEAAFQRTVAEFNLTLAAVSSARGPSAATAFCDL
jgi:hypothetical protein